MLGREKQLKYIEILFTVELIQLLLANAEKVSKGKRIDRRLLLQIVFLLSISWCEENGTIIFT